VASGRLRHRLKHRSRPADLRTHALQDGQRARASPARRRSAHPEPGDRIEVVQFGVRRRGTVHHADALQVLVAWDGAGATSLRRGVDRYRIIDDGYGGRI
jgi:hypothetical protein